MNIFTNNYYLTLGVQTLLRLQNRRSDSTLSVIELSNNQYALIQNPDCQKIYYSLLDSYMELCVGILSRNELHHFLTHGGSPAVNWTKPDPLSEDELATINLLLADYSIQDTAALLGYTTNRVYTIRARAGKKMGVRNFTQLVVRLNLLEHYLSQIENVILYSP